MNTSEELPSSCDFWPLPIKILWNIKINSHYTVNTMLKIIFNFVFKIVWLWETHLTYCLWFLSNHNAYSRILAKWEKPNLHNVLISDELFWKVKLTKYVFNILNQIFINLYFEASLIFWRPHLKSSEGAEKRISPKNWRVQSMKRFHFHIYFN